MLIALLLATAFSSYSNPRHWEGRALPAVELQTQSQSAALAEASELEKKVVKLYEEQKFQQALPFAIRVLEIRESVPNPELESVTSAHLNLAEVYLALGRYGQADRSYARVRESYKKLNVNDVRLANVLERIALVQFAMTNYGKAEAAHQEALRIKESLLGPENPLTMQSIFEFAEFYQFSGNYAKAVPLYQRVLSFRQKTKEPNRHLELSEVVDRYACALRKLNKREEADNLEQTVYGSAAPTGDPGEAKTLGNVLNGRALWLPKPAYPETARAAGIAGTVVVRVTIDEKGNVIRACAIEGPRELARTSERSAYGAKFTPTKLSGQPIKVMGVIRYNYVRL